MTWTEQPLRPRGLARVDALLYTALRELQAQISYQFGFPPTLIAEHAEGPYLRAADNVIIRAAQDGATFCLLVDHQVRRAEMGTHSVIEWFASYYEVR